MAPPTVRYHRASSRRSGRTPPRTRRPRRRRSSRCSHDLVRCGRSLGRKAIPVAYRPDRGQVEVDDLTQEPVGTCSTIPRRRRCSPRSPTPPVLRLHRAVIPLPTISCWPGRAGRPRTATPQESCSWAGSRAPAREDDLDSPWNRRPSVRAPGAAPPVRAGSSPDDSACGGAKIYLTREGCGRFARSGSRRPGVDLEHLGIPGELLHLEFRHVPVAPWSWTASSATSVAARAVYSFIAEASVRSIGTRPGPSRAPGTPVLGV